MRWKVAFLVRFICCGLILASCATEPYTPQSSSAALPSQTTARAALKAQMQGVWRGTFRRFGPDGTLIEALPSEVQISFPEGGPADYRQTNILTLPDGRRQTIATTGNWNANRLVFSNPRVDGWFMALPKDASGLNSVLFLTFKDGSGLTVSEIITLSPDGTRRMRAAQYVAHGQLIRRTLIDEVRS
jgi:hypothetical protein